MRIPSNFLQQLYARHALKVGAACLLAYGLSLIIGAHFSVWAVVSAVIAMQMNVAESFLIGVNRIIGTLLGACLGIALLLFLPKTPHGLAVGVLVIVVPFGYLTRYGPKWSAASIAASIVLLSGASVVGEGHGEAIFFGLARVGEIIIGVCSAFVISLLLWPVRLVDTLRADLGLQYAECARLTDALISSFLKDQGSHSTDLLESIEAKAWTNHERLSKTRKHESALFRYDHRLMEVQVITLDRVVEHLRTLLEALNDYEEGAGQPPLTQEFRALADAVMDGLRHIGGDAPTAPVPDLVRRLTIGIDVAEGRLSELRLQGDSLKYSLHTVLQFYTFYQTMRQLVETLLLALHRLEGLKPRSGHAA